MLEYKKSYGFYEVLLDEKWLDYSYSSINPQAFD